MDQVQTTSPGYESRLDALPGICMSPQFHWSIRADGAVPAVVETCYTNPPSIAWLSRVRSTEIIYFLSRRMGRSGTRVWWCLFQKRERRFWKLEHGVISLLETAIPRIMEKTYEEVSSHVTVQLCNWKEYLNRIISTSMAPGPKPGFQVVGFSPLGPIVPQLYAVPSGIVGLVIIS